MILLAHAGDRDDPRERYYFAPRSRSWHGSPSIQDSALPLIVAHPGETPGELHARVRAALGNRPFLQRLTNLVMALRENRTLARARPGRGHFASIAAAAPR